jgi:cytoskeletal protein RodZ
MGKKILSNKSAFLIATMLSTMMLAILSTASLVPVTAFAQEIPDIEALTQTSLASTSEEEDTSNNEGASTSEEEDTSNNEGASTSEEEDTSNNEGSINSVDADPVVETDAEVGVNVNADTHVITDEADCDEANDEVGQANAQSIDQQDRSEGEVSPKLQYALEFGFNFNADTDVMVVDCNPPSDDLSQANAQSVDQDTGNDGEGGTIVDTTYQRADVFGRNIGINNDVMEPVL